MPLTPSDYKNYEIVEEALAAVVRGKTASEQAEVDAMAKAINDAIAALQKVESGTPGEPGTPSTPDVPATGDQAPIIPIAIIMLIALGVVIVATRKRVIR